LIAFIQKYFWVILIAVAFLLGLLISGGKDEELREKYEKEREESGKIIAEKDKEIELLMKRGEQMRVMMREDSVKYAGALQTKDRNITSLENTIKKVDYRNARAGDLDSLRRILLLRAK
jgi:predicted RNase H-like nuclease (RuvC/YqgF family)